jgi:enoyl-CoA hydratase/carnithine racemase
VNDIEDPHTTILQERRGRVAIVTLNRPERLNALNAEMRFVLLEMLHDLDHDDDVHVVVLTGAGRGFCSGADRARLEIVDRAIVQQRYDTETIRADFMLTMKKPVIAAVNGPVAGIGVAYAAMADIRIAAAGATWIAPFAGTRVAAPSSRGHRRRLGNSSGCRALHQRDRLSDWLGSARRSSRRGAWYGLSARRGHRDSFVVLRDFHQGPGSP